MRSERPAGTAIALAAVIPWTLGAYAVFIVSAQYTGLGLFESYAAFQGGSTLGNVIWFLTWSGMTGTVCWTLARRIGRSFDARMVAPFILFAYAVPSMLLISPGHGHGIRRVACPCFCGWCSTVGLIVAVVLSVIHRVSARRKRVPARSIGGL